MAIIARPGITLLIARTFQLIPMRFILPVILLVLLIGCEQESTSSATSSAPSSNAGIEESVPFRKDGTLSFQRADETYLTIDIEIADTDSAIVRGLMQRTSLPDMSGMLFLMPTEEPQQFWMSNTQISLDILFANSNKEIVSIQKYTTPLSQESVDSEYPALYVIEVEGGFTDSQGILEGDVVDWVNDRLQSK